MENMKQYEIPEFLQKGFSMPKSQQKLMEEKLKAIDPEINHSFLVDKQGNLLSTAVSFPLIHGKQETYEELLNLGFEAVGEYDLKTETIAILIKVEV